MKNENAEQPAQQEPVAIALNTGTKQGVKWLKNVEHGESLYTTPQPAQQEPVAWMHEWEDGERIPMLTGRDDRNTDEPISVRPLVYADTSPPAQRTWVGLTDGEWMNIVNKDHAWYGQRPDEVAHEVAKLVEAKLKEKNT